MASARLILLQQVLLLLLVTCVRAAAPVAGSSRRSSESSQASDDGAPRGGPTSTSGAAGRRSDQKPEACRSASDASPAGAEAPRARRISLPLGLRRRDSALSAVSNLSVAPPKSPPSSPPESSPKSVSRLKRFFEGFARSGKPSKAGPAAAAAARPSLSEYFENPFARRRDKSRSPSRIADTASRRSSVALDVGESPKLRSGGSGRQACHASWSFRGCLCDPPPEHPPTLDEFAHAMHVDLYHLFTEAAFAREAALSSLSKEPVASESTSPHGRPSSARLSGLFIGKTQDVPPKSGGGDAGTSFAKHRLGAPKSGGSCSGGPSRSDKRHSWSPAGLQAGYQGPEESGGRGLKVRGASGGSLDEEAPVSAGALAAPAVAHHDAVQIDHGLTEAEHSSLRRHIMAFVETRTPSPVDKPMRHDEVEAWQWLTGEHGVRSAFTGDTIAFTRTSHGDSAHDHVRTAGFSFFPDGRTDQTEYMQRTLTRLRIMLCIWKKLENGALLPWEAAAKYSLLLPLNVSVVVGQSALLPTSGGRQLVNAFITYEQTSVSLSELLLLRPVKAGEQFGKWQLMALSFSEQIVTMLGKLSDAGIPVAGVDADSLALTPRGALVVTDFHVDPAGSDTAKEAKAVAKLLFQLWCQEDYSSFMQRPAAVSRAALEKVCSPLTPVIVIHAILMLAQGRITLEELRTGPYRNTVVSAMRRVSGRTEGEKGEVSTVPLLEQEDTHL